MPRNNVRGEAVISAENSRVAARTIPAAEALLIVNHAVRLPGPFTSLKGMDELWRSKWLALAIQFSSATQFRN